MIGFVSAAASYDLVLFAGLSGLVAGAVSMAAGEYVSVRSQADVEQAFADRQNAAIKRLVSTRMEVLEKLSTEYRNLIRDLAALEANRRQYLEKSEDVNRQLGERLFWMRSAAPVSDVQTRAGHWAATRA